jgi:hypothetical protein
MPSPRARDPSQRLARTATPANSVGRKAGRITNDSVFFGDHAKSELFASVSASRAFIRRAIWLEANLNVKRDE